MYIGRSFLLALLAASAPAAVLAQAPASPAPAQPPVAEDDGPVDEFEAELDEDVTEVEAVVVTAERQRGAVLGDIPPEVQLDARDVRALGAGTLAEVLEALAPQIRSGRGRGDGAPVVLLNGRRISGFSEIRGIPPEAIERVDILPEEVALRYGFRADQRVVNFVLRERFRAVTAELELGVSTAGGREEVEADLNALRIRRDQRTSFDIEYQRRAPLLESQRDVVQSTSGSPFDIRGNIGGAVRGGEIDPALSALAGQPVTVAGVPASAAGGAPTLADFAETAGSRNTTDLGRFRTLLPESDQLSLNATYSRPVFGDVSATVNARLDLNSSESRLGLPSATFALPADSPFSPFGSDVLLYRFLDPSGALTRTTEGGTGHLGFAANGSLSDWRWSLTANYDLTRSVTRTDTGLDTTAFQAGITAGDPALNPFASLPPALVAERERDRSLSTTSTANAQLVVNGKLLDLPAGPLSTTFRGELESRGFRSETLRARVETDRDLSRERGAVQASLDLPIASRRREVLSGLGNLSANFNVELDQLSDFGSLNTLGYGLNWSPIEKLSLIASVTEEDGAPSVQQLGNPVLLTPNVPVFDFSRGETVDVTRIEGGNPDLVADSRTVVKLGLNLKPFEERDLSLSANYTRSRIRDQISSFPTATPEIEAAFPERFTRDAAGRLLSVDNRPVNFASAEREEIRTGLNYSKALRTLRPAGGGGGRPGALGPSPAEAPVAPEDARALRRQAREAGEQPRPGGGFRGGGGGRGGGGFGGGRFGGGPNEGRLQFSLYHTYRLQDKILIREGVPVLNLLNGSAVGSGGGQSRHEVDLQAGLFRSGLGARVEARWRGATFVRGDPARGPDGSGDLFFSDLTTVNLRLFADLGQQRGLVREYPWLRGSRISLALNNLFDQQLEARDAAGATPVGYQADLLDPVGRSVRVSFRKLFIPVPARFRRESAGRN